MIENLQKYKFHISLAVLLIFNIIGVIGIRLSDNPAEFLSLTPLNLLLNFGLLLWNIEKPNKTVFLVLFAIAVMGFAVEAIGVNTGKIFGEYSYGSVLGWKVFNTPLMIGINWAMLVCYAVYTFSQQVNNKIVVAFMSATALVLLDYLIEPVAIKYDFWNWSAETVPIQNYIAWWVIALVFCLTLSLVKKDSENRLAIYSFMIQIVFFTSLNFVT